MQKLDKVHIVFILILLKNDKILQQLTLKLHFLYHYTMYLTDPQQNNSTTLWYLIDAPQRNEAYTCFRLS